jgi:hypothetical protein
MVKKYVIGWKSVTNGRTGLGKGLLTRQEAGLLFPAGFGDPFCCKLSLGGKRVGFYFDFEET